MELLLCLLLNSSVWSPIRKNRHRKKIENQIFRESNQDFIVVQNHPALLSIFLHFTNLSQHASLYFNINVYIYAFLVYKRKKKNRLTQCALDGFVFDCCFALCGTHATLQAFNGLGGSLLMRLDWQHRRRQICCSLSLSLLLIRSTIIWAHIREKDIMNRNNMDILCQ